MPSTARPRSRSPVPSPRAGRRGRRRGENAQGIIEAALTLPVFLLLLCLTIDIGRAAYTYVIMGQLAQQAARTLSLPDNAHADCSTFANAESSGNGYTIVADPLSIAGDGDPVATPSAPTQGSSIAANT